MIRTPIYQPRIPIGRGGGVIDLSSKENESNRLIAQAVGEMFGNIAKGMQKQPVQGKIVMAGDKALLIDPYTGETIKEIPMPPEIGRKVIEGLEEYAKINKMQDKEGGLGGLPPEIPVSRKRAIEQELMEKEGLEKYEEEYTRDPWWGKPRTETRTGVRKKGVQPQAAGPAEGPVESKTRPPQPKEYPDAEWSEEHQMWTIIKNGRIMGVK